MANICHSSEPRAQGDTSTVPQTAPEPARSITMSLRVCQCVAGPDSSTPSLRRPNQTTRNLAFKAQAEDQRYQSSPCQETASSCRQSVAHFFELPVPGVSISAKAVEQLMTRRKAWQTWKTRPRHLRWLIGASQLANG